MFCVIIEKCNFKAQEMPENKVNEVKIPGTTTKMGNRIINTHCTHTPLTLAPNMQREWSGDKEEKKGCGEWQEWCVAGLMLLIVYFVILLFFFFLFFRFSFFPFFLSFFVVLDALTEQLGKELFAHVLSFIPPNQRSFALLTCSYWNFYIRFSLSSMSSFLFFLLASSFHSLP
jgi:hypothetical protein